MHNQSGQPADSANSERKSTDFPKRLLGLPWPALLTAPKKKTEESSSPLASQLPPAATKKSIQNGTFPEGCGLSAVFGGGGGPF